MRALFFAEGGLGIGLGHLRRCTALADAMTRRGWDCRFLARETIASSWLSERGQKLAESPPPLSGRLPEADYSCDAFVVDSYEVSNKDISDKTKGSAEIVLAFDDHMNRHPAADIVLNTGVFAPQQDWPGQVERLLGPSYHPLPSDYLPLPKRREINTSISRVLVTLGGSGNAALFERIILALRQALPDAAIEGVVGPFAEEPLGLKNDPATTLNHSPRSLKPLMLKCDLAVASSGQTLLELSATGTPTVAISLADNQRQNLLGMERTGAVLSAGATEDAGFEQTLIERLVQAQNPDTRQKLSELGRALVDGQGAARIEAALTRLLAKKKAPR
jgi:spore coat polysaccharide biosynthesis predicted glycosyltransferase SpsG